MLVPDGGSLVLSSAEAATGPTPFQPVEANSATAQENTIWVPHAPRIVCAVRGAERRAVSATSCGHALCLYTTQDRTHSYFTCRGAASFIYRDLLISVLHCEKAPFGA